MDELPADLDVVDGLAGFAATLRAAGLPVSPERVAAAVAALAELDATRRSDVYWAGRLTLCSDPDHFPRYDAAFAAYFGDRRADAGPLRPRVPRLVLVPAVAEADTGGEERADVESHAVAASATEQLRHRDVRTLTAAEREQLHRLLAALSLPARTRRTRRRRPAARGEVDGGRTLRAWLTAGGEPARLRRCAPSVRPRRVVLLVDVSGSMDVYADALLRFAHAATRGSPAPTEVFALGTRLTRVTRELSERNPDAAMAAVAAAAVDAGGGTRLGELLKDFLDRWGQRGTARGAVVVILSDGWERGDAALLGAQMARLHRLAHRVVWANPLKGAADYAPLAGGMAAALPHVDDFVAGHSLAAFEHLAAVIRGAADGVLRRGY